MEDKNQMIKLKTEDGQILEISMKAAQRSNIIKYLIETDQEHLYEYEIKLVNYDALKKIREYLEHYESIEPKKIPKPLKNFEFKEIVDGWDYDYIGKEENIEILENLIMSASFLDIKPLIDLLAAKIAHKIKSINSSTIRNIFGIKKLSDKEREQLKVDKETLIKFNNM